MAKDKTRSHDILRKGVLHCQGKIKRPDVELYRNIGKGECFRVWGARKAKDQSVTKEGPGTA